MAASLSHLKVLCASVQRLTLDNVLQITHANTRSTVEVLGTCACNKEYLRRKYLIMLQTDSKSSKKPKKNQMSPYGDDSGGSQSSLNNLKLGSTLRASEGDRLARSGSLQRANQPPSYSSSSRTTAGIVIRGPLVLSPSFVYFITRL